MRSVKQKTYEFCLSMHSRLGEDAKQMGSDGCDRDPEAGCGCATSISLHDFQCKLGFCSRQTDLVPQALLPKGAVLVGISDQDDGGRTRLAGSWQRCLDDIWPEGCDGQLEGRAAGPAGDLDLVSGARERRRDRPTVGERDRAQQGSVARWLVETKATFLDRKTLIAAQLILRCPVGEEDPRLPIDEYHRTVQLIDRLACDLCPEIDPGQPAANLQGGGNVRHQKLQRFDVQLIEVVAPEATSAGQEDSLTRTIQRLGDDAVKGASGSYDLVIEGGSREVAVGHGRRTLDYGPCRHGWDPGGDPLHLESCLESYEMLWRRLEAAHATCTPAHDVFDEQGCDIEPGNRGYGRQHVTPAIRHKRGLVDAQYRLENSVGILHWLRPVITSIGILWQPSASALLLPRPRRGYGRLFWVKEGEVERTVDAAAAAAAIA